MKLFKKALLATAIFGAMGAQAADVTDAVTKTSKQGIAASVALEASSVRVIVREQLEAGDIVYLEFGDGVDISGLTLDDTAATTPLVIDTSITIKYGSGTYTLSTNTAESDLANNILALEVNTGDPVTLDSSFEIELTDIALVDSAKADKATVTYSAKSGLTGNAKDTTGDNVGAFYVLADQYAVSVSTKLDGVIVRNGQATLKSGGTELTNATNDEELDDTLVLKVTDNQNLLSPVATAANTIELTVNGNFEDYSADLLANGEAFLLDTATTPLALTSAAAGTNSIEKVSDSEILVTLYADSFTGNTFGDFQLVLSDNSTDDTFAASTFTADAEIEFGGTAAFDALVDADAGQWKVDATLIKVPYFPVGYDQLDTSVHFSNENSADVNVIMTAFDDESGTEYEAVDMGDLAGEQVTKFSQGKIKEALGIAADDSVKLSVTFNIDATGGTVKAYAYSRDKAEGSRHSLAVHSGE
ncbi:hypothetical protein NQT69_15785 [Pseudoalteromonas shioyasakiensis]|uniref:hypothetical protein n=1 Tax=Pseudoalteromonas shioyasakiensis TaxID=1190813 RepID=UPI0021193A91|nr:hypothetical protein [Pseudoalteromonas shioyasakiensis]MCQ8879462.1 hypothetical protein [Pseudoalteromonas shioyasakiensis]